MDVMLAIENMFSFLEQSGKIMFSQKELKNLSAGVFFNPISPNIWYS